MKKIGYNKLDNLLSMYIDGELSGRELEELETLLKSDPSIRSQVEELKRLKDLLASKKKLNPDIGFWTRMSVVLDERTGKGYTSPFSLRKYFPAVSVTVTALLVAAGVLVIQNRMQVMQYLAGSHNRTQSTDKKISQSSLLPLFSKVDRDRALQFSLLGTLPLDEKSETALRVDEQADKGYRIEVGKGIKTASNAVTFKRFLSEVKPTERQKRIIDSLLDLTGKRIESSVLIGDNNTMAIAPDLPRLNMIMVANIASCLAHPQRVRFKRFLESNDAPYTVRVPQTAEKNEDSFSNISEVSRGDNFFIITPDTFVYSRLHIDFDSLKQQMETDFAEMRMRREAMLKRMMRGEFQGIQRNPMISPRVQVRGNEGSISIEINQMGDEAGLQQTQFIIRRRVRQQYQTQKDTGNPAVMQTGKDTSGDSLPPVE